MTKFAEVDEEKEEPKINVTEAAEKVASLTCIIFYTM